MSSEEKKPVSQMTEEELVQAGTRRAKNGAKRAVTGVVVFLILVIVFNVGNKLVNSYPEVTPIGALYGMEYPGDYIQQNIGKKVHYSDIVVWQVDASAGLAQDLFSDIYFKSPKDAEKISPFTSITIKGEIEGINSNDRLVIKNAVLEEVFVLAADNTESNETQFGTTASLPDDYYDVALTAKEFMEEAQSNTARMLSTYAGKRVLITDLEIQHVGADDVYFGTYYYSLYFRNPDDIYQISEGDKIDVIGSIEEEYGMFCINDAILADTLSSGTPSSSNTSVVSGSASDWIEAATDVEPANMFDITLNISEELDGCPIHLGDIENGELVGNTIITSVSLNRGDFQIRIEFADEQEALIASDYSGYAVYGIWDSDTASVLNAVLDWDTIGPSDPTG